MANQKSLGKDLDKWSRELETITHIAAGVARNEFAAMMDQVEHREQRMVITEHRRPKAAIIPLGDLAVLLQLEKHPDLLTEIRTRISNE